MGMGPMGPRCANEIKKTNEDHEKKQKKQINTSGIDQYISILII
jgi:hypothetical protein